MWTMQDRRHQEISPLRRRSLGLLSENRESNDSVSVPPKSIAHSICTSSPIHSPTSADTRLSRFLGSGRITGYPHRTGRIR